MASSPYSSMGGESDRFANGREFNSCWRLKQSTALKSKSRVPREKLRKDGRKDDKRNSNCKTMSSGSHLFPVEFSHQPDQVIYKLQGKVRILNSERAGRKNFDEIATSLHTHSS